MKPLLSFILCLILSSCSTSKKTLNLFVWSDYIAPEVIEAFEKDYDCTVVIDTYDSNESMYAKLQMGASGYDIIFPTEYFVSFLDKQEMLEKLEIDQLPNYHYIDWERVKKLHFKPLETALPYMISYTGIGYRNDRLETPSSWTIFGDKAYQGRMTMLSDLREVIGVGLLTLGYNVNTIHQDEINAAKDLIISWKKNLAKFESEQYKNGIASAEFLLAQSYSGEILQVMEDSDDISFVIPKEGGIISNDTVAILKNAPHKELAYAFINNLLDPKVAARNMLKVKAFTPNLGAYNILPKYFLENDTIFPSHAIIKKSQVIRPLGKSITLYQDAWDEIKNSSL
ncbi:spermidine/putrescine ABC transporter substrate-binding protein [Chlamydiales bacterium]|nr:spermidine/putrescine ABC transporter substrate-binding protein [Chlamydiales bacterium]